MNKNLLIGIVVLLVLGGGWFFLMNKSNQPASETLTQEQVIPSYPSNEKIITLTEQNSSSESGTAILAEENGKVKVTLKLTGAPANVEQPAHIHVGACPEVGAVKYSLTNVVNGMSETVLDVTLEQLRSELPLGLNVHKSAPEVKVYVSCGDLVL